MVTAGATTSLTAAGVWTYSLNNSNPTVQALNVGQTLTDSFHGHHSPRRYWPNSSPIDHDRWRQRRGGDQRHHLAGRSTPRGGAGPSPTARRASRISDRRPQLNLDADSPIDAWNAFPVAIPSENGFGTYALTAAGVWTYTLDNSNAAVQELNLGETLTDSFTATTVDGTAQVVTITINGANDAAVITGVATGSVTEAGQVGGGLPGVPVAVGNLDSTDVDNIPDDWLPVTAPTPGDNGYGAASRSRRPDSGSTGSTTAIRRWMR